VPEGASIASARSRQRQVGAGVHAQHMGAMRSKQTRHPARCRSIADRSGAIQGGRMSDHGDVAGNRWVTYAELAQARGIAAVRRSWSGGQAGGGSSVRAVTGSSPVDGGYFSSPHLPGDVFSLGADGIGIDGGRGTRAWLSYFCRVFSQDAPPGELRGPRPSGRFPSPRTARQLVARPRPKPLGVPRRGGLPLADAAHQAERRARQGAPARPEHPVPAFLRWRTPADKR
jgi:hypothetical protein